MLFIPASEASATRTRSGTCPTKGMPSFFASSAIAKKTSRGSELYTFT
jgi:hypothetical protein